MMRQTRRARNISRREFLRAAGLFLGGTTLGSLPLLAACSQAKGLLSSLVKTSSGSSPVSSTKPTGSNLPVLFVEPAMPSLFALTISGAPLPGQPADASGYSAKINLFIDWHLTDQARWFRYDGLIPGAVKMLWQVATMPFSNSAKTMLNPPGLVASGTLTSRGQEFGVDFSAFVPAFSKIKGNLVNSNFFTVAQQNAHAPLLIGATSVSNRGLVSLTGALSSCLAPTATITQNAGKLTLLKNANALLGSVTATPDTSQPFLVASANQNAIKAMAEATGTVTVYKYYVRVIGLTAANQPVGAPSNTIQVLCGDPMFETAVTALDKSVEVRLSTTGEFQFFTAANFDWNSGAQLKKEFAAPLATTKNYAYSYFQVTGEPSDPVWFGALHPASLAATIFSSDQIKDTAGNQCALATIDFRIFAPAADPKTPTQTRYYVRAVHVYSDFAKPGFSTLAFSPAMLVNYGDPKAISYTNPYVVDIDIGTPSIRFTKYTPPYFGDDPADHAIVTSTPGSPFNWLKPGDKCSVSGLAAWLADKKRDEDQNILNLLQDAFLGLFNGLVDLITYIGDTWTQIQASVVSGLSALGIPPAIGGFLVNAALLAAGIPPTLPNFDDLSNLGADYLASQIVEQSGGIVPDAVAKEATKQLLAGAKQAASTTVSGLEDDLSALNGNLKPDTSFVWKPSTITLELYNPLANQIPSGTFYLRMQDSTVHQDASDDSGAGYLYVSQTVNYPPIQAGQTHTLTLTIPLDENLPHNVYQGVKSFGDVNMGGGVYKNAWWVLTLDDTVKVSAIATNIQPKIPDPADFATELGLQGLVFVNFNILPSALNIRQDMGQVNAEWTSPNDRFPGSIYVTPGGSDSANGSLYHPLKTLDHALAVANENDAIILAPGTYPASSLSVTKAYLTIAGLSAGAIVKTPTGVDYAFKVAQTATEFALLGLEVDGGVSFTGVDTLRLEDLRVLNPRTVGLSLSNCKTVGITRCEVGKSGTVAGNISLGISLDNCYAATVQDCDVHDIAGGSALRLNGGSLISVKNSTIHSSQVGISMTGNPKVENCYIHDTSLAGVILTGCNGTVLSHCTLQKTVLDDRYGYSSLYFDLGANPSQQDMQATPDGPYPKAVYAQNCIFAESDNDVIAMVNVSDDHKKLGIIDKQYAYLANNIYHSDFGEVRLIDLRSGTRFQFNQSGWVDSTNDRYSKELDPKLDAQGRSVLPDCAGCGVQ